MLYGIQSERFETMHDVCMRFGASAFRNSIAPRLRRQYRLRGTSFAQLKAMNLSSHQTDHQWPRESGTQISRSLTNNPYLRRSISVMADDYVANEFGSDGDDMKTGRGRGKRGKSGDGTARVSSGAKAASILRKSATTAKPRTSAGEKRSSKASKSGPLSRSRSVKSATKTARKTVGGARAKKSRTSGPLMSSASRSSRRPTKKSVKSTSSRAKRR
jgi:hypothetical protein